MFKNFIESRKRRNNEKIRTILETSPSLSDRDVSRLQRLDKDYQFWNRFA